MVKRNFLLLLLTFLSVCLHAQDCTDLGQTPSTAFPVCGSSSFNQSTVTLCGYREIPSPCMSPNALFQDLNPYWYKFTCFSAGNLGFLITPNNLDDDYDWQLFDVTNHNPDDVYTSKALFVACNWSGRFGKTGASSAGTSLINCEGGGYPTFSKMPDLQQGHNYLLLVSHFTSSQSGYTLDFNGGTAGITDTTKPKMLKAKSLCNGQRVSIKLNKKIKCSSLASDGSDFAISRTPAAVITSASAPDCSGSFDMDSLILTMRNALLPGNYTVIIKNGVDNNTLLDNCDAAITAGDSLFFTVFPALPSTIDSIRPVGCAPDKLQLVFKTPLFCNSIAADGSDFTISGPLPVTITGAGTVCSNNTTSVIELKLSQPIYLQGKYAVTLQPGSDGNTIFDECSIETQAGSTIYFSTNDTVSAIFDYAIKYGCKADTVVFSHNGANNINLWKWQFNSTDTSARQSPVYVYKTFGPQQVKLAVSNGTCSDTATAAFDLDNELKARFTAPNILCPEDKAAFKDTSIGKVQAWNWDFGNGSTSSLKNPPSQLYPLVTADKNFLIKLTVKNDRNCFDTAYKQVKVLYNCYIAVPSAFTPNGDNRNDYLYPVNAWKARNLIFKVYNRLGQLVFKTEDFTRKWDGTVNGLKQQTGTYVWTLQYIHSDSGQPYFLKGTTVLIR